MKRKKLLAATSILALLASMLVGAKFRFVEANFGPVPPFTVSIQSPVNGKTYDGQNVPLTFIVSYPIIFGGFPNCSYSLDGVTMVSIKATTVPIYGITPTSTEVAGALAFSGSLTLTGLLEGEYKITVYVSITSTGSRTAPSLDAPFVTKYLETSAIFYVAQPPRISILSLEQQRTYNTTNIPLYFSIAESTRLIAYRLDWQANVTINGNTSLTGLTDGLHRLIVYAEDVTGNTGTSETIYFTIAAAPSILVISPDNKTYSTSNVPLNFTVNESVSQITYSLDGQENVTIAGNTTLTGLPKGIHRLTVYAQDAAGNIGASRTINFSVEPFPTGLIVAPVVSIAVIGVGLLAYFRKRNHK